LVVDEAHLHSRTDLAQGIIDWINPKVILHITATPEALMKAMGNKISSFTEHVVEVPRESVVEEGLIKEKILVQAEEDLKKYGSRDLDEILIDLGLEKRKEILQEYKEIGKKINPLVLIQLPNDDTALIERGEKTKEEVVLGLLKKKGVDPNKVAKWFDNNPRPEFLEENDDEHEYLLFKQAAGTGWDCPRAHILVMFREINSETFYVQTVGRILRMAEPNNKEDYRNSALLRTGFLFTNYERNKVSAKWNELSPNKPETQCAKRKTTVKIIQLASEYVSRLEYGDLSNSAKFQASFVSSMNKYFKVSSTDKLSGKSSKKLQDAGINLKPVIKNQLIVDAKFKDFDQLAFEFSKQGHDITLEMSVNDVEKTFNYYCYKLLKEQTEEDAKISNIARSWSPLKSAIRVWLKGMLNDESDYYYRVFVEDVKKDAGSIFRPAITQAIKEYKPILQKLIAERRKTHEQREAPIFTIQQEYWYTDDYEEVESELCALDKCYLQKEYEGKINETDFIKYIDKKAKDIDWWFKNRDYGKEYFAVKYWHTKEQAFRLFYPDWIIKFKDGRVGIFDTKSGDTALPEKTADKAKALALRLNSFGKNYFGGILVKENGVWYCNSSENYDYIKGKLNKDWKKFEDLL
ncbi:MAG TPA: hypothetical protein PLI99_01250, partial [archaeon]|nr:hypothetical protein [archaeon]